VVCNFGNALVALAALILLLNKHSSSRTCVTSRAKVPLVGRYQTQVILAVTGL